MTAIRVRIGLAVVWFVLGIGLLLRAELFPADWFAKYDGSRLDLAGWLALFLAVWNAVRAYRASALNRIRPPNPLRHDRPSKLADEFLPEFDFSPQETGGKPSTSTD